MTGARIRRRVVVSGRVQGVAGWVRNLPDGSVEAAFEGDPAAVEALVDFCRAGTRPARVEGVEVCEEPVEGLRRFDFRF